MSRILLSTCLALVLLSSGGLARADGRAPAAPQHTAKKLILAGSIIGGVGYIGNAGISIAQLATPCGAEAPNTCPNSGRYAWGLLPLAGPWIEIGYSHDTGTSIALYAIPGALQVVGATLVVAGIAIRNRPTAK